MSRIGYVKLHRKIIHNKIFKSSSILHIWLTLLMKAAHSSNSWRYKGREYSVKPGELFTSQYSLSNFTSLSRSKIYRALKKFESEQMIITNITPYGTHIQILNWREYQVENTKRAENNIKSSYIKNDIYKPLKKLKKYI
tara:strand:+ start:302 stop:718 length:417 start_codon:yes stop_codon:yes gene_type:complete